MFNGCQHCHFAACRDFDDRLALVSEGRNREERAHEEELRILLKEWDSKLGEIGNQFDRNAALASGEARRGGLTEQASPGLRGDAIVISITCPLANPALSVTITGSSAYARIYCRVFSMPNYSFMLR